MLSFASVMSNLRFCNSIINILLDSKVSYKWPVLSCETFAALRIALTVTVRWLIWFWTLVLISTCLLFAFVSWVSVNLLLSWSLASGVPATTFSMNPRKSNLLATLWCVHAQQLFQLRLGKLVRQADRFIYYAHIFREIWRVPYIVKLPLY